MNGIVDVTGLSFSPNELKITGDNGYEVIRAARHNAEMKAAHGNGTEDAGTGIGAVNVRVRGWEHTGIIPMPADHAVESMHIFIEGTGAPDETGGADVWGFLAAAEYFKDKLRDACEAMEAETTTPTEEGGEPPGSGRRLTMEDRETHNVILSNMGAATPSGAGPPAEPAPRASRAMRLRPPRGAAMRTALFVIGLAGVVFGLSDSRADVVGPKTQGGELRGNLKIGPCAHAHDKWTPAVKCSRGGERVMDASSLVIDTAGARAPASSLVIDTAGAWAPASSLTIESSGAWETMIESDHGFVRTVMQSPTDHPQRHEVKRGVEDAGWITSRIDKDRPVVDGNIWGGEPLSPEMISIRPKDEGSGMTEDRPQSAPWGPGLTIRKIQNRGAGNDSSAENDEASVDALEIQRANEV
jgi:hypothetical protein